MAGWRSEWVLGGVRRRRQAGGARLRLTASPPCRLCRYDWVKVKVKLGEHLEHYYILSRFLLSRMLTVIKVPQHKVCAGAGGVAGC